MSPGSYFAIYSSTIDRLKTYHIQRRYEELHIIRQNFIVSCLCVTLLLMPLSLLVCLSAQIHGQTSNVDHMIITSPVRLLNWPVYCILGNITAFSINSVYLAENVTTSPCNILKILVAQWLGELRERDCLSDAHKKGIENNENVLQPFISVSFTSDDRPYMPILIPLVVSFSFMFLIIP